MQMLCTCVKGFVSRWEDGGNVQTNKYINSSLCSFIVQDIGLILWFCVWFAVAVLEQPKKVTIENNSVNSLQVSVEYSCAKCQYMHFLFDIGGKNHTTPCTNQSHKFSSLGSNRRFDIRVYVITNYSGNNLENRISVGSKSVSGWTCE